MASRYAANPLLSRRYSLLAVSTFTGRLVSAADSRRARVDAFLAELDEERSGATMRLSALLEAHASASVDWPVAWRAAASRDDLNCPICLQTLASRPAVLLRYEFVHVGAKACKGAQTGAGTEPRCTQSDLRGRTAYAIRTIPS